MGKDQRISGSQASSRADRRPDAEIAAMGGCCGFETLPDPDYELTEQRGCRRRLKARLIRGYA